MNINAIIVDDEASARNMLKHLIMEHCPLVHIVDEAQSVKEAVKLINKNNIDIVFLDIEMGNENGFALFDYFEKPTFETIFCTAYAQYAVQAFDVSAVDYILKPIDIKKLQQAIEKAIKMHGQNSIIQRINTLKENLAVTKTQKLALPLSDGLIFVKIADILYFEAEGSYTNVTMYNKNILITKKIKYFEDLMNNDNRFFRTHRSYLVNIDNMDKYIKKEGASILFENGKTVPVAREKIKEFDEFLKSRE